MKKPKLKGKAALDHVERERKEGESLAAASRRLGYHPDNIRSVRYWYETQKGSAKQRQKEAKKYKRKATLVNLQVPPAAPREEKVEVLIVRGTPSEIAKVLEGRYGAKG